MASLVHVDRYVVNIDHKSATVRKPSSQVPVPLQRASGLFVLTSTKPSAQQLQQQQKPNAQLNVSSTPPVGRADTPQPSPSQEFLLWHRRLGHVNFRDAALALSNAGLDTDGLSSSKEQKPVLR